MRTILSENNVVAFFDKQRQVYTPSLEELDKKEAESKALRIGHLYSLRGVECDGFTMPKKVYEVIAIVNELNGCVMDSVVMKQVDGEVSTIFSLTRNDCKTLGVEFQTGLQLFPQGLDWQKENQVEEVKPNENLDYNPINLSTYPCDFNTHKIRRMCCKLYGFKEYGDMIHTPYGDMTLLDFTRTLRVETKTAWEGWVSHYSLPYNIITYDLTNRRFRIVDNLKSSIYLEVDLESHIFPQGIDPSFFKDKSFSDLFEVSWKRNNVSLENRIHNTAIPRLNSIDDIWKIYRNDIWQTSKHNPNRYFVIR